jgi:integrase
MVYPTLPDVPASRSGNKERGFMSTRRKNITDADYKALLEYFEGIDTPKALACLLLIYTGARANEILKVTHKSILIEESGGVVTKCAIMIRASKRGKDRIIELPNELLARIKDLSEEMKEQKIPLAGLIVHQHRYFQSMIDSAYEQVRQLMQSAQLELFGEQKYTLHSFRHTLAVRAIKEGYNIVQLKTMLGHANIGSTHRYLIEYEESIVLSGVHKLVKGK